MNRYKSYRRGWYGESKRHSLARKGIKTKISSKFSNLNFSQKNLHEYIKGGLSSGMPDSMFDKNQLEKGVKVELEHTPNKNIAKEIAKDHLSENSKYYDYLEDMEKKMKKEKIHHTKKHQKTISEIFFNKGQRAVKGRVKRGENGDIFGAVDDILTPLPEIDYAKK
jgi:hypothetical protein